MRACFVNIFLFFLNDNLSRFLYRIRPAVAHRGFTRLSDLLDVRTPSLISISMSHHSSVPSLLLPYQFENNFSPLNPRVHISATQLSWSAPPLPPASSGIDFIRGLKTMAGNGDPTLREGIAIHMYTASASMENKAFCNSDGDFLIVPQEGRLDIQTEFGRMMVRPGEIAVVQRGMRFKVRLPDGPSRGCGFSAIIILFSSIHPFLLL